MSYLVSGDRSAISSSSSF